MEPNGGSIQENLNKVVDDEMPVQAGRSLEPLLALLRCWCVACRFVLIVMIDFDLITSSWRKERKKKLNCKLSRRDFNYNRIRIKNLLTYWNLRYCKIVLFGN